MQGQDHDPLVGTRVGEYRITRRLGMGAFGTVYEGVHPDIGTRVAIKVLHHQFSMNEAILARFEREAKAVATLNHPNIVSVLSGGRLPDGRYYTVMEYVEGVSLADLIRQRGRLQLEEIREIVRGISDALAAIHDRGIVHRDLKPDNVMINFSGIGIHVKILDFGIAKLTEGEGDGLTSTGEILGTPAYMAPEQARGEIEKIGPWTDIYALGVMVYQMFSGTLPIKGRSTSDTLLRILTETPPPLTSRVQGVPPAVDAVIQKALAKDPFHRYQRIREFFSDFDRAVAGAGAMEAPTLPPAPEVPPPPPPAVDGSMASQSVPQGTNSVPPTMAQPGQAGTMPSFIETAGDGTNREAPRPRKKKKKSKTRQKVTVALAIGAGLVLMLLIVVARSGSRKEQAAAPSATHDSGSVAQTQKAFGSQSAPSTVRRAEFSVTAPKLDGLPLRPKVIVGMDLGALLSMRMWQTNPQLSMVRVSLPTMIVGSALPPSLQQCLGSDPEALMKALGRIVWISPSLKGDKGILLISSSLDPSRVVQCLKNEGARAKRIGSTYIVSDGEDMTKILPDGSMVMAPGELAPLVKKGNDPISTARVDDLLGPSVRGAVLYVFYAADSRALARLGKDQPSLRGVRKATVTMAVFSSGEGVVVVSRVDTDSPSSAKAILGAWKQGTREIVSRLAGAGEAASLIARLFSKAKMESKGRSVIWKLTLSHEEMGALAVALMTLRGS